MAFPIYRVIGYPIIILTAPLYSWLTPENKAWSIASKAFSEYDHETFSRVSEALDRWDEEGDCVELQECCKRVKNGEPTKAVE